ncbi:helix-turn-helix domain-containing protein [Brevibacillus daliensis]|uniref:helix-turn-helix domain-containing protein n=1 Tax=Brevibacillus daliensis TaxID=2892995 RepID=UPI001E2F9673|nr:helix-turn-helix transcriptional regulator [Brevibacillus daliensis]
MNVTHVGKRLRHFRKNLRMTQEELAVGICNRSYVSQIEKGNVIPSPEILDQLAKRLQTDLKELWTESEAQLGFSEVEIQNALRHIVNRLEANDMEISRKWLFKLKGQQLRPQDQTVYLWAKAELAQYDQRFEDVGELLLNSIQIAREVDDPISLVRSLQSLGYFYGMTRQAKKAIPLLNEALQVVNRYEIGGLLRISLLYTSAKMHGNLEEYYSAIELLNQAVSLNEAYGTMYKSAHIYMGLAICHLHLQNFEHAETYNLLALEVLQIIPDEKLIANTYNNLGILYRVTSRHEQAEVYLLKSLEILQKLDQKHWTNNATSELAQLYKDMGQIIKARDLCESIITNKTTPHLLAETNLTYAEILAECDEHAQALYHLEQALAYFSEEQLDQYAVKSYKLLVKLGIKSEQPETVTRLVGLYK